VHEATQAKLDSGVKQLVVNFSPAIEMTDKQFFEFCQINRDLRIERTATGKVILMAPAGGETGGRNAGLTASLYMWARQDGRGVAFDSSTGFKLPNGATRSPDASWVLRERLLKLTAAEKQQFLPLCPDFVIELRSPSDRVVDLQDKMQEYIDNGARLGWLLVPDTRSVYVYRPDTEPEQLSDPAQVTGDPVLPGFVLALAEIWNPGF
jgi:Uma2 family endonuclease